MDDRLMQRALWAIPAVSLLVLAIRAGGPITGLKSLLVPVGVLAVFGLLAGGVAVTRKGTLAGRMIEVRTAPGHGPRVAAVHEGGHVALTKAVGGKVHGAQIWPDGSGVTHIWIPDDLPVADEIAINVAGHVASRTSSGCSSDFAHMEQALNRLPHSERAAAKRAGYAKARQVCHGWWSDGGVAATADELMKKGRI